MFLSLLLRVNVVESPSEVTGTTVLLILVNVFVPFAALFIHFNVHTTAQNTVKTAVETAAMVGVRVDSVRVRIMSGSGREESSPRVHVET